QIYEAYPDMYRFEQLPALARLILDGHTEDFARVQYELSRQFELPLLQHLSRYSFEELMEITRSTQAEFLKCLADNAGLSMIRTATERWLGNQLQVLHYYDVLVEDITVLNHIRAEALRRFIPQYTTDLTTALQLTSEIDRLLMGFTTSSMINFIDLLRQRIASQETQLLEAESIAHLGSFDWDITSNQTRSSPEMRRIIGNNDPIGLELFLDLVHPDDSSALQAAIAESFAGGQLQCEFRLQSGGQVKTVWARGVVHFDESGQPLRMLGVIQDVSDRKRMEETLLLKTLELERSNEELQQFASVASHDLKEPLRKIALYSGLIENEETAALSPAGLKNLERIKDAARRMRLLIEDILAFSSLSKEGEAQPVSLERLFGEVVELLESRIRETGATVHYDGLPEAVVIPFQFRQLFQNLLSNSLKFIRPDTDPVIHVRHSYVNAPETAERLAPARRYLQLEFSDNGIGFPEHYAEKIFGLFSRLHSRNQFEGTGLGLAICRKVVENHGGRIEAVSTPGGGATFRITIPQ
ncbi:MAG: PAS domain-containing sensor histidine kinase, partial [Chitinophagaceae bacterium]